MYKKRFLFLVVLLLVLTGCTKLNNNIDDIVNTILMENPKVNTVSTNYELYIPSNVLQIKDNKYNQVFKLKNQTFYLYADTISYYYKNTLNYPADNSYNYYFKELKKDSKTGYIGINKTNDNLYYCKVVYNYAKIEFYSDEENMKTMLANSLIMLNSIKYNENLIKVSLGEDNSAGKDITYELNTPSGSESNFSDFLQEYIEPEETEEEINILPDEE